MRTREELRIPNTSIMQVVVYSTPTAFVIRARLGMFSVRNVSNVGSETESLRRTIDVNGFI